MLGNSNQMSPVWSWWGREGLDRLEHGPRKVSGHRGKSGEEGGLLTCSKTGRES